MNILTATEARLRSELFEEGTGIAEDYEDVLRRTQSAIQFAIVNAQRSISMSFRAVSEVFPPQLKRAAQVVRDAGYEVDIVRGEHPIYIMTVSWDSENNT